MAKEVLDKNLEQKTKRDCVYYNWSDNPTYSSYPREYGAKCHKFEEFFSIQKELLKPNCPTCEFYKKRDKKN